MENMDYSKIEYVNSLSKKQVEKYIDSNKKNPESSEKYFLLGYSLFKLDRLDEAANYFSMLCIDELNKVHRLFTGYRKGIDGNWHSYDDSNEGCDDCCSWMCVCFCLSQLCGACNCN